MRYASDRVLDDRTLRRAGGLGDRLAPGMVCLAVLAFSLIFDAPPIDHVPFYLVVVVSAVAAGVARRWRWPLFVTAAVAWLAFGLAPAAVVSSYYAATKLRRSQLVWYLAAAAFVWVLSVMIGRRVGGEREEITATFPNAVFSLLIMIGLPLAIGLWVDARRQILDGLRERAERLEREQTVRTQEARARERARIAREMHDVVAHRVSLMVLHAGALEVSASDERTAEEAALIRTTGREALANLREVLGVLRSPSGSGEHSLVPPPVLVDLDSMLGQSRATGVRVDRTDRGRSRRLPVLVEQTAYRVVQEAMTNVHKHAAGADAEVEVRYLPDSLEVRVRNQPTGCAVEPLPGSGLGLAGLRERVDLLGGHLDAGPTADGGFVVHARLPAPAVEEPE